MTVALLGTGLWAPGFAGVEAALAGRVDPSVVAPASGLLPPATARRATFLARVAADVVAQGLVGTGVDPASVGLVLGTVGGELATTFEGLDLLDRSPPEASPLRFRNSVHNAALGHLSIALGATGYASALAADPDRVVAMSLLEGALRVLAAGEVVAVVVADERWPTDDFDPLGVGFLLGPVGHPASRGELSLPRRPRPGEAVDACVVDLPSGIARNPSAQGVEVLAGLARGAAVLLASRLVADEPPWVVAWRPA